MIPRSGPNNTVNVRTGGDEKSDLASLAANIGVRIVNNVSIFIPDNPSLNTQSCIKGLSGVRDVVKLFF